MDERTERPRERWGPWTVVVVDDHEERRQVGGDYRSGTQPMRRVRVYVADDHPLYRESLADAIKARPDFELVGQASDGSTALAEIERLRPDVAVLDQRMPGLHGLQVLQAIRRQKGETRVVFLSAYADSSAVYRAIAAGAHAYLSKAVGREALCNAIAAVARGETVLSRSIQAGLAGEIHLRARGDQPALTPREREVLALIADGHSAPEIAQRLQLSPATVKTHLANLYEKLGVSDRAAAVAEAMRRRLLE